MAKPVIEFRDFSFRYTGSLKNAISGVNLSIYEGDIVILAGASGCGKSTFLRSIIGLIPHMYTGHYSGSVLVDGLDVAHTPISKLATKVGYVFQNPENQLFMFSVESDVAFGLENLGLPREEIRASVNWALSTLKISDLALKAPHEISDGQKQRVAIAGVLAMKPKVLLLDEPTSLLDPRTAGEVIQLTKELHDSLGITLIIVEHRLDLLVRIASRVIILDQGRVVADGPPREVLAHQEFTLVGVNIPVITRVDNQLGLDGQPSLTVEDLAFKLNDRVQ